MICPIICSQRTKHVQIPTPNGYPDPPAQIICPVCSRVSSSEYRLDKMYCDICFCICCKCGKTDPYLACRTCHGNMGSVRAYRCNQCNVCTTYRSPYCPKCGSTKN